MDLLKTILLYLSMLYISSVQIAPDPATVNVTPTPVPTPFGIYATATPVPTPSPTPVPTPNITPNSMYDQLIMGDRNETVADMQRRLQELGYYTGEVDGAYGNQTRHAVELFQYQNGLVVDGIAGKYTLTVIFESDEVKPAPAQVVVTNTPPFYPDDTNTPPPPAQMSVVTPEVTPTIKPTPSPTQTLSSEVTVTQDPNLPILIDSYVFVLEGYFNPITAEGADISLSPVEAEEVIYVPLAEILKSAGNVVIENTEGSMEELVFSVLTDFYRVSYTLGEDGSLSNLAIQKNTQPQPLVTRNAILMDGILYLPLQDVERITGIGFTMDDVGGMITVNMPLAV